jgi:3-hydroxybutyrate dehydrogenase
MLKGKCALVTGSIGGIGNATARALAMRGCHVMLHGLEDPKIAEEKRQEIAKEFGVRTAVSSADLSKVDQIEQLFKETERELGPLEILVNNAVTRHAGPVEEIPVEKWDLAIAVNLSAPFHLIRMCLPGMKKRRWGRIINIASNWGLTGTMDRGDYVASKHGVVGLTKAVALENLDYGITCNAIAPGATLTPNAEKNLQARMKKEGASREQTMKNYLLARQPSGRFIAPEDVAELIVFLCGDSAKDMTGSPISIDGGWLSI